MQKNDIIELKIEDMGVDGEGIGKYDGMTFFVKDAVLGDRSPHHKDEEKLWLCESGADFIAV
jgi:tRNA/tmRNA/rRNA uracil-C5-methylase (TrmA/RlmC/RlmD family)